VQVCLSRLNAFVSQPEGNDCCVDAMLEQVHGACVAENVRRDFFAAQRWAPRGCRGCIFGNQPLDCVGTEVSAADAREERIEAPSAPLAKPDAQHRDGLLRQWCRSLLATFATAAHMRISTKLQIADGQSSQLGDAQAGLDYKNQQSMVPTPGPAASIGSCEQCLDFLRSEEVDHCAFVPLGGYGEHPLNLCRVLGVLQGGIAKERANGCQAVVAGADGVVPVTLEMRQEGADIHTWRRDR